MFEPGQFLRRALFRMPSHFVAVDTDALNAPRQFASTDHLSAEAVAAFVDGELQMKAHMRAASHLSACRECAAEVDAQGQARSALRESRPISMPTALMGLLSQIPESAPPEPPPVPGELPPASGRGRRKRR